jgi:hypothetical protein
MSHFTSLKTKIKKIEILIKTLDSIKLNWSKKKKITNKYNKEIKLCDLLIKQKNGHNIAFSKNSNFYELIYDEMFWEQSISIVAFTNKIKYNYSLITVSMNLSKKGYNINLIKNQNTYNKMQLKLNAFRFN